jgi:hypothetical protein
MADLTAAQILQINKMNEAARRTSLGTAVGTLQTTVASIKRGAYTVVAADDTANYKTIVTGLAAFTGFIVQVYRAGVIQTGFKVTAPAAGSLKIEDAGSFVLTADDVIYWTAWA